MAVAIKEVHLIGALDPASDRVGIRTSDLDGVLLVLLEVDLPEGDLVRWRSSRIRGGSLGVELTEEIVLGSLVEVLVVVVGRKSDGLRHVGLNVVELPATDTHAIVALRNNVVGSRIFKKASIHGAGVVVDVGATLLHLHCTLAAQNDSFVEVLGILVPLVGVGESEDGCAKRVDPEHWRNSIDADSVWRSEGKVRAGRADLLKLREGGHHGTTVAGRGLHIDNIVGAGVVAAGSSAELANDSGRAALAVWFAIHLARARSDPALGAGIGNALGHGGASARAAVRNSTAVGSTGRRRKLHRQRRIISTRTVHARALRMDL